MLIQANALQIPLAAGSVQCVVTSPPYWGLRDYGTARWEGGDAECNHVGIGSSSVGSSNKSTLTTGSVNGDWAPGKTIQQVGRGNCRKCGARRIDSQLGLERTPEEYVANMVAVFREVRRVLKNEGTLWLNIGDSYSGFKGFRPEHQASSTLGPKRDGLKPSNAAFILKPCGAPVPEGLKPKDLVGIPWRVAFALQADGWYLRSDIIWSKPNPMPESVTDRPTKAHEYLFLLAKSERYFYDAEAIREPQSAGTIARFGNGGAPRSMGKAYHPERNAALQLELLAGRNKRSVWGISTQPWSGAHFATFPEKLVETCLLAGSRPGDIVFDPFVGSGTVIRVATRLQRRGVGCDLNFEYLRQQARKRASKVQVEMQF